MGAGAIGSVIGGMLALHGHRVILVGRRSHMDEISNRGLHISGIWGEHTINNLIAMTQPPKEYPDIIFLCTKSFDTLDAARQMLSMIGPDTVIVPVQNGLGNIETLSGIVGEEKIVGAIAIFGSVMRSPAIVKVTVIASEVLIGEIDGSFTQRVGDIVNMLNNAAIPTKASDNILRDIWHKVLYNIALNPLSALFQVSYGHIADNPDTRWLIEQMISEAFQVAEATGVDLGMDSPEDYLEILWNKQLPPTRVHLSSMLQDINLGKKTEIDHINGAIVELGARYGIATPYNNAVVRMVKAKEKLIASEL